MSFNRSIELFQAAQRVIPGGVNSPVRAFKAVGGQPLFIRRGQGAYLYDVDGNTFVDYVMSWGPLILGHAYPAVVAAIEEAARAGTSFGAPTEREIMLAEMICAALPSVEQVRLVNSGTEATMTALRLARGFTEREKFVKFDGGYHGHADMLLAAAGSGMATLGVPECPGVPAGAAAPTLVAPYNDLDAVRALFRANPGQVAAVIVEPVAGNMGVVPPASGFLAGLRELTAAEGALLIFDEVITGFRVAYGGAQGLYGVQPDLTCLGKVIGGGLPVGAFGGRRDVMQKLAPVGPVYQAGTLSGNPLATAAGIAALRALGAPGVYDRLETATARLVDGLAKAAAQAGVPVRINRVGSLFSAFFTDQPVTDYRSAKTSDTRRFASFFRGLLERGVYVAPSQFEAWFVSLAHGDAEIDRTVAAAADALGSLGQ